MKYFHHILSLLCCATLMSCSDSSGIGTIPNVKSMALDATHKRVFTLEDDGTIYGFDTLEFKDLFDNQPFVYESDSTKDEDVLAQSLYEAMPRLVDRSFAIAKGDETDLVVMGAQVVEGDVVTNRAVVLESKGLVWQVSDSSPWVIADDDSATLDAESIYTDVVVDEVSDQIFVLDQTLARVLIFDTDYNFIKAIALAGTPQGLAYADDRVYSCNVSDTEALQNLSVINLADDSVSTIAMSSACDQVYAVHSGDNTLLAIRFIPSGNVGIFALSESFDAVTAIAGNTDETASGSLKTTSTLRSAVNTITGGVSTNDLVTFYLGERDGSIHVVTLNEGLTEFSSQLFSMTQSDLEDGFVLVNDENQITQILFMSERGAILSLDPAEDHKVTLKN